MLKPRNEETKAKYWTVWATHVENHSTLVQTAQTFGYSIGQVCRITKWCAKQLQQDPVEVVQGQVWNKLRRLRAIQPKREQVMGEDNHQAAIGYLREERELENDIAKLQGAERHLLELTGANGGPLQVQTIPLPVFGPQDPLNHFEQEPPSDDDQAPEDDDGA